MHGRIKVRTSEEERERKKKEQALKVKAYRAAMGKIQAKRQRQELDDEMLLLTSQILLRNPDVATLWNIRRECVQQKDKALQGQSPDEEPQPEDDQVKESVEAKRQSVYDAELGLTEQCLMVNPKSYGGWHHRCWTLEHSPRADWQREMQLCNKYLKLDERNFHTWDYRRYVVARAGVGKQQELDYCTEKIKTNFSNYSSWTYRSQLLPLLHPYEGEALPRRPMSEPKLKEELEMVLTAAFTDPNDSSAWFYQRWLLGYSRPELDVCAFRCNGEKAVLAFTKPIAGDSFQAQLTDESGQNVLTFTHWSAANRNAASSSDTTWVAALPTQHALNFATHAGAYQLEVNIPTLKCKKLTLQTTADSLFYFNPPNRSFAFSAAVLSELQSQLESCNSLLEYEPDSKWTLLTTALLMRAIDRKAYQSQSLAHLEKLQKVDFLRAGYYKDLASNWVMEQLLTEWAHSEAVPKQLNLAQATQLNSVCYAQYLSIADEIVLSKHLEEVYGKEQAQLKTFGLLNL